MQPPRIEPLLTALCLDLGFCLPPAARVRLINKPPQSVDDCVDALFNAEGLHSNGDLRLRRQVRESVAAFFQAAEHQPAG